MKTKNIKVLYATRTCKNNNYLYGNSHIATPKISMEGKWLEALGFHIGDKLQVDYEEGAIHIHLAQSPLQPSMICEPNTPYTTSDEFKSSQQN